MTNSPSKLLTFILWRLEVRGWILNSELLADVKRAQFSEDAYYATIREATDRGVLAFDSKMRLVLGRQAPVQVPTVRVLNPSPRSQATRSGSDWRPRTKEEAASLVAEIRELSGALDDFFNCEWDMLSTNKNAEVSCETSASENELTDESAS